MSIQIGQKMPVGAFKSLQDDRQVWVTAQQVFGGRRVVLFSCPGAFTTRSTLQHVPGYRDRFTDFRRLGVDAIVCISVNDPWVMQAWAAHCDVAGRIEMFADPHCEYHTALGLQMDCTRLTLGWRSHRFSMLIEDGIAVELNVEAPGAYEVSDAAVLLEQLRARAEHSPGGCLSSVHAADVGKEGLTPIERRNAESVRAWAALYRLPGGSASRLVDELYADAPEVISVLTDTTVARAGVPKDAWRQAEVGLEERCRSRRIVLLGVYPSGNTVAVEGRTEQLLRDGTELSWPFAVFLTFDGNGRIARDRTYMLPVPHQAEFDRAAAIVAAHDQ